jgi:hypothetical protein
VQEALLADPALSSKKMRCMTAIWPPGPPKLSMAIAQTRAASPTYFRRQTARPRH